MRAVADLERAAVVAKRKFGHDPDRFDRVLAALIRYEGRRTLRLRRPSPHKETTA